jgi:hypothetical protein
MRITSLLHHSEEQKTSHPYTAENKTKQPVVIRAFLATVCLSTFDGKFGLWGISLSKTWLGLLSPPL